ncbi:MAG: saccharopine dehydrogenase NADP-binding domain-containing protein [Flavobacteriales bacterium]|nr:saccharopine dehydrogenase NADP-binding domain-containing protein [Flavobacteriales bacterium]MBL6868559.1 saccharopine dehydrogenase NADP-binding domain-containing protein [Flavobacteriales bacterium]
MKKILVIGSGRSSTSLIKYLLDNSDLEKWTVTVVDFNLKLAESKIGNHPNGFSYQLDANDDVIRKEYIKSSDVVISMLPAHMHFKVLKDSVDCGVHVITPSYITDEIKTLNENALKNKVLVLNELGLDPGIDHMSAKKLIDQVKAKGGDVKGFESYTGGLVAPESDDNPWNYKFTWNPRNVVLAGQGGSAKFIKEGKYKYIPYHKLFRRTEIIDVPGYGKFEGYPNRDSLKYRSIYELDDISTMYRGTLRKVGFCRAWNIFVQLGATDDSYIVEGSENMTNREFINSFLKFNTYDSVELKLRHYLRIEQDDYMWEKLVWLGIFEDKKIGLKDASPAQILQKILQEKWTLSPQDKDMIVMWHRVTYTLDKIEKELISHMAYIGKDSNITAMSDTVGLPLGIATKMLLNGSIKTRGVVLPLDKQIYDPILKELKQYGIDFLEHEK